MNLWMYAVIGLPARRRGNVEAAGLARIALLPLTSAFFAGRLGSNAFDLGGAKAVGTTDTSNLLTPLRVRRRATTGTLGPPHRSRAG